MSKSKQQEIKVFEERIKYLQLYLDHMMKENESLKQKLEDMKHTADYNKNLLKDYILNISNKDQIVEKLQCTVENLQERIKSQEDYIKKSLTLKNLKSSNFLNDKNFHARGLSETMPKMLEPIDKSDNEERRFHTSRKITSTEEGINSVKEFFNKQKGILDELGCLRKEVQYLFDNTELFSKNINNKEKNSELSEVNSFISKASTDSFKNLKINLVDKFSNKLKDIIEKSSDKKSVILFLDENKNIWEIMKRSDLSISNLIKPESISSISNIKLADTNENQIMNFEIKNAKNDSFHNSEIEIIHNTELNILELMEDSQQDYSDY